MDEGVIVAVLVQLMLEWLAIGRSICLDAENFGLHPCI